MSVELHHTLEGPEDAPVVVFSNSLGTRGEMWDVQAAALSDRLRVLRYDTRGHGRSPVPPGPYSLDDLGGDVVALLDRLGLERVSFCGLSIGGMTGMWLGVNAPERIDRLVICCTGMQLPPAEMWTERAAQVRAEGLEPLLEATIERWFTPDFPGREPELIERIKRTFLATPREGYAACCEALATADLRGTLGAVRAPTLVIAGEEDPVGTPERMAAIAEEIEDSRLVSLPGARHLAAVEKAAEVTAELERHLAVEATR
ncbi:MAG: 3-oxoadipate enol-lactonase [Solirubrobacterales bacterium]